MSAVVDVDEFSFRFVPKRMVLDIDLHVPKAGYTIAWRVDDGPKQTLRPSKYGPQTKVRDDGKFVVDLSPLDPFAFPLRFRVDPADQTRLEPHWLQLKLFRVSFNAADAETEREKLYDCKFDLRELLKRTKATYTHAFTLNPKRNHCLEMDYTVTRPQDDIADMLSPRATLVRGSECVPGAAGRSSEGPPSAVQMFEGDVPMCSEIAVWNQLTDRFERARQISASSMQVASVSKMIDGGLRRDVQVPAITEELLFNLMFADGAPFGSLVHAERRNTGLQEGEWRLSDQACFATKVDTFTGRFGQNYHACTETSYMFPTEVAGVRQYCKISLLQCPGFMEGVKLQFITQLRRQSTGGCIVEFVAFAHFNSACLAYAGRGTAQKLLDKLMNAAVSSLKKLTASAQRATGSPDGAAAASSALGDTIHFDLWYRLPEAVHADVVGYLMERLFVPTLDRLLPDADLRHRLHTIDHLMCRFPRHRAICRRCLEYLDYLCNSQGPGRVVSLSCVIDLLPDIDPMTYPIAASLTRKLTATRDAARDDLLVRITQSSDPFGYLARPEVFVLPVACAAALRRAAMLTLAPRKERVDAITRAIGMHLTDVEVFDAALAACGNGFDMGKIADQAFFEALRQGMLYHPEVALGRAETLRALSSQQAGEPVASSFGGEQATSGSVASSFSRSFGAYIAEAPLFTCEVFDLLRNRQVPVYVTKSFVCVDTDTALPLSALVRQSCRTFLSGLKPAVEVAFLCNGEEVTLRCSTWRRSKLLTVLGV